jgi:hypothetical protein
MDEAEVRMPLEAYHHLLEMLGEMRESEGAHEEAVEKKKSTRKKTSNDKAMSKGLREANAKAKLKNGSWRKGWNQSKLMTEAHRLRKKYS